MQSHHAIHQSQMRPATRPGIAQRLLMGGLALLLFGYAVRLLGIDPLNLIDISLTVPVLVSWGAILLMRYHELRGIELHLRRKPARVSLAASRQALRDSWRHVWQAGLLLMIINGIGTMAHIQDVNRAGHFTASLLIGLIYLIAIKGLVVVPLEIGLARCEEAERAGLV